MRRFTQSILILWFTILLPFCILKTSNGDQNVCRALALRGGGTKGAYEVGVFRGLIENLNPGEVKYDVVVGASVGAFNAAAIALFSPGEERKALAYLEEFWLNNLCQDSWAFWETYLIAGFYKNSLLDDSKIIEKSHLRFDTHEFKRELSFHAVDIKSGTVVIFNEQVPKEHRAMAVKSSGSYPGFFSPVELGEFMLVDGGVYDSLELTEAVLKCQNRGFDDEDIVIDVILCLDKPVNIDSWTIEEARNKTVLEIGSRKKQILEYNRFLQDVTRIINGFPRVKFRYIVQPSQQLPSYKIPIYSELKDIQFQLELGRKDAENIIRNGQYSNIDHINNILIQRNQQ